MANLPNVYFNINHVLQCFSVVTLIPLLTWCEQHDLELNIGKLSSPEYLSLDAVDADTINKFTQDLKTLGVAKNQNIVNEVLGYLQKYKYNADLSIKHFFINKATSNKFCKIQEDGQSVLAAIVFSYIEI